METLCKAAGRVIRSSIDSDSEIESDSKFGWQRTKIVVADDTLFKVRGAPAKAKPRFDDADSVEDLELNPNQKCDIMS